MARTEQYERLLDQLASGELSEIEKKVYSALRRVFPAALTRYELIEIVFGYRPDKDENLNNSTEDRKIRTAIASMFEKGIPIISNSGSAGYCIDIDESHWDVTLVDLRSKEQSLREKVESAERIINLIRQLGRDAIPTDVPEKPKQLSLLEVQ